MKGKLEKLDTLKEIGLSDMAISFGEGGLRELRELTPGKGMG